MVLERRVIIRLRDVPRIAGFREQTEVRDAVLSNQPTCVLTPNAAVVRGKVRVKNEEKAKEDS
jgi:hypothetical protein